MNRHDYGGQAASGSGPGKFRQQVNAMKYVQDAIFSGRSEFTVLPIDDGLRVARVID